MLSAGPTPRTPLDQWTFSVGQPGGAARSWTWQEMRALPAEDVTTDIHCVTRWSKLDTQWQAVSIDTLLAQVEHDAGLRPGVLRRRLHHQPAAGGPDRRPGLAGVRLRRRAAGPRARRPGAAAGAAPVLLEERQVGARAAAARLRRARVLGDLRLPHVRGPMAGTAVRGRLTWQFATVGEVIDETPTVRTIELDVPDWAGHRAGQHLDVRLTARGRVCRRALVLDRLGAWRAGRDHGAADR